MPNSIRITICGFLILFGLGIIAMGLRSVYFGLASKSWPTAIGKIVVSEVGRHSNKDKTIYTADIKYDYAVNGKSYSGSLISFGHADISNPDDAKLAIKVYPVNMGVHIYYDQESPNRSVLNPGVGEGGCVLIIFGLVFTLFVTFVFFLDRRSERRKNRVSQSSC